MKLFTFSYRSQWLMAVYQVIAYDETRARELLMSDGHSHAGNPRIYELETSFRLSVHENKEGIPFTMEVENENHDG